MSEFVPGDVIHYKVHNYYDAKAFIVRHQEVSNYYEVRIISVTLWRAEDKPDIGGLQVWSGPNVERHAKVIKHGTKLAKAIYE